MIKRIVLTGGGSGGHVFPLVAVAEELKKIPADLELHYVGPKSPLNQEFLERDIPVRTILGSKIRRYLSFGTIVDIPKFFISLLQALFYLYRIMPDAVFSKGGTGAFPVVFAAWCYRIPVVIHESDSVPGLQNRLSGTFAKKICISFSGAADYFKKEKLVFTGNPIREALLHMAEAQMPHEKVAIGFKDEAPLLFIVSGSQGAARINRFLFDNFELLLQEFQIYHQVGPSNTEDAEFFAASALQSFDENMKRRYKMAGFLSLREMQAAYAAADIVLSRAGASGIFEIAAFGKPSLLIPLQGSANDHQRLNAYEYAKGGAAVVVEESNLTPHVVVDQAVRILKDKNLYGSMSAAAKAFSKPDAAKMIARELTTLLRLA